MYFSFLYSFFYITFCAHRFNFIIKNCVYGNDKKQDLRYFSTLKKRPVEKRKSYGYVQFYRKLKIIHGIEVEN